MIFKIIFTIFHRYGKICAYHSQISYRNFIKPTRLSTMFLLQAIIYATAQNIEAIDKDKKEQKQRILDPKQIFDIPIMIKQQANKQKMVLVMDLDETMVQTRKKKKPKHQNYQAVQVDDQIVYVEYRPYIKEFLAAASELFTVVVYTAGTKGYADQVIQKRFYREACRTHQGNVIKDLQNLRNLIDDGMDKTMILVDDNCKSITFNHPYSIRIKGFEGDQKDKSLLIIFYKLLQFYKKEAIKVTR